MALGSIPTFLKGIKVRTGTLQTQTKILKVKVLIYDCGQERGASDTEGVLSKGNKRGSEAGSRAGEKP